MRALVFSHTVMGRSGFCTNVGEVNEAGDVYQLRLRVWPNRGLKYTHFDTRANLIRQQLRPGSIVEIARPYAVADEYQRITHPEDAVMPRARRLEIVDPVGGRERLQQLAEQIAFESAYELFPGMHMDNNKWYRPGDEPNLRAVGYVRVQSVNLYRDYWQNLRATLVDHTGHRFDIKVVGIDLVANQLLPPQPRLARLSLANPLGNDKWANSEHPSRCYLMLSHVM